MVGAGHKSGAVGLWEISSGKTYLLPGHTRHVGAVTFSPDSGTLISGGLDGVIKVWDVARRQCTASFTAHTLRVVSLALSPDGNTLASGSTDHTIKLWDLKSKKRLVTLSGHKRPVFALAFAPDGTTLASGSADRTVKLWDVASRGEVDAFQGHAGGVRAMVFSPDGKRFAFVRRYVSEGEDAVIVVNADGTGARQLTDDTFQNRTPHWSPDGDQIAFQACLDPPDCTTAVALLEPSAGCCLPKWFRILCSGPAATRSRL
jgi:WD40 repeat protein